MSCRRSFALTVNGDRKPKGSKMELTVPNIPLLVCGLTFVIGENMSLSVKMFHFTPRVRSIAFSKDKSTVFVDTSDGGNESKTV